MDIFESMESEVRSYCRSFPTVFTQAKGHVLRDEAGKSYIDFFAGAGSLNYGHNHPVLQTALINYLQGDGVLHSLDMHTSAKREFLETFRDVVLQPREMDYKVMFPGPTGTNAVESALKLARKVTGRHNVVSFTNGFHGMTLGSLALTGNGDKRAGAFVPLQNVTHMPYCNYVGDSVDTLALLESSLKDNSSGMDRPAAFILETVQAEGGVNVASRQWLIDLYDLAKRHDVLMIIDDIQVGCGRTGPFFSFETFGIEPDIVCLSKSLSGFGLPFAVTLMKPELDLWEPGEHNGTFRGHNAAFVTATAALDEFWRDDALSQHVAECSVLIRDALLELAEKYNLQARGRGMIQGVEFEDASLPGKISRKAFERGLIIETAGAEDQVLKLLPPLTIPRTALEEGLEIVSECVASCLTGKQASLG